MIALLVRRILWCLFVVPFIVLNAVFGGFIFVCFLPVLVWDWIMQGIRIDLVDLSNFCYRPTQKMARSWPP